MWGKLTKNLQQDQTKDIHGHHEYHIPVSNYRIRCGKQNLARQSYRGKEILKSVTFKCFEQNIDEDDEFCVLGGVNSQVMDW